ncbi:MAG: MFS transporter [Alphaproteobacteria bacterium]|nr:MAG: MFS transporter [Alphaproteobacteria bacterium]
MSVTTSVLCFTAQGLAFVSLPFYFQDVIGVSAVATGLLMTPWPATSALMAPFAGRLADRYPAGILGSIGLAIVGVGFVLLAVLPAHPGTGDILWRIAVCGGGMGLFQQPNARAIVMAAPRERSGGAGAIQGSARLLGQSIGAAMVALVFGVSVGGRGALTALVLAACFAAVATVVSLTRQFDFVRAGRPEHEPSVTEPADAPGPAA